MTTLADVAKKAGVSLMTVSRVINNKRGKVSEETRKRILETVKELNYYPNAAGRALQARRVNTIGILTSIIPEIMLENPYYIEIVMGVEAACSKNGFDILLSTQKQSNAREFDYLKPYYERKVDGMIIIAPDVNHKQMKIIEEENIPCVIVGVHWENCQISYVDTENYEAEFRATEWLLSKGHRKIAFVKGQPRSTNAPERFQGFQDAVKKNNLVIPDKWIIQGDFSYNSGREALLKLIETSGSDMPTAVICANDMMALGLLSEAAEKGIHVPDDLSVIGFDGIPASNHSTPVLTTLDQPLQQMGQFAAEMLFRHLSVKKRFLENRIFEVPIRAGGTVKDLTHR